MTTIQKPRLHGDRPKSDVDQDEFGLAALVVAISELLADRILPPGYIVGLEGTWGSGKSTIAEFVEAEISRKFAGASVVHIHPWELGNESNFAPFLMGEIAKGVDLLP